MTAGKLWKLYGLAGLVMLLALRFHPVGEEAIYPISTLEMWQQDLWFMQPLYGLDVKHNPLLNWLIMPVANLLGWPHVLAATRLVTIAATLGTGLVLGWLVERLGGNQTQAALSALTYLTFFDVLCYHGWLGYADPTYGFFIFSAIALLWVATRERRTILLLGSVVAISLGFLTKAQTAYVFYATALFVLLWRNETRPFLLRPSSVLVVLAAFAFPFVWYALLPGGHAQGQRMAGEIVAKLSGSGLVAYLQRLITYPLEAWLGLFPTAWLATWLGLRHRGLLEPAPEWLRTGGWMALLMLLPYWLVPQGGMRYLIPVYPLLALYAAGMVWRAGEIWQERTRKWMQAAIALQAVIFVLLFPYYQSHFRGEGYEITAREVLALAGDKPVYCNDSTAAGLNLVMYLDVQRYPRPAVTTPPANWSEGFLLSRSDPTPETRVDPVVRTFRLGGDELVLTCRGSACAVPEYVKPQ